MWKIRHQGSPTALSDLTLTQVAEGLADGRWEPTDEVMGPNDATWVPIEIHPQLEAIAAELEPPPPHHYDDETRLDMTPLIDVCLVLLIFFILTTSYAVLQKRMEAASISTEKTGPATVTTEKINQQMIWLKVKMENGQPAFSIETQPIDANKLDDELRKYRRATEKTQLLLQMDDDVPHSVEVAVFDAARIAGIQKVALAPPGKG